MRREEKSWGTIIICAFALVSVVVIAMAAVKSCRAKDESSSEAVPVMETLSPSVSVDADTSLPDGGKDEQPWEAEFREQIAAQVDVAPEREYIGKCRITVYNATESSWGYQTATGRRSEHLTTCAVDPKVIPYGSVVIVIDKDGEEHRFRAVDCGGFSGKWIDIFYDGSEKHGIQWLDECFGGEFAEVWVEVKS